MGKRNLNFPLTLNSDIFIQKKNGGAAERNIRLKASVDREEQSNRNARK